MVDDNHIGFKEIEHTADYALKIQGHNLEELLVNAAHGMNSLMVADLNAISAQIQKKVDVEAVDAESLLVEWLSELAYWAETEMLVFKTFDLHKVLATQVQATLFGGKTQKLVKHIKAVTYHNLKVVKTDKGLEATVVFDV
jgi:SHS2 domain-containing protein